MSGQQDFTPGKDPVPIAQEAGCAPEPVWTGVKSRPHGNSIPDRLARSSVAIPIELPGPRVYICTYNFFTVVRGVLRSILFPLYLGSPK